MSKPIGYYTSHTPGDTGLLAEMEEEWGSCFDELEESDLAWMIYQFGYQLWRDAQDDAEDPIVNQTVQKAVIRAQTELTNSDKLGIIQALIDKIKGS